MAKVDLDYIDFANRYKRRSCQTREDNCYHPCQTREDNCYHPCQTREDNCYHPRTCQCCICEGVPGADGKSAYQIAVDNGFIGTQTEWLESLKGEAAPFLSSYLEAVGTTQTVGNNEGFIFDLDPDIIDVVGNDIEIDSCGSTFTIVRAGLYRVEWSMNILTATNPVLVGLLEDDTPSSALSNNSLSGNYSSGALISVSDDDLPYRIVLHNFGAPISITNPSIAVNTAVSIRISRFADAPNN